MAQAPDRFDASPSPLRRVDLVGDRFDRGPVNRQGEERDAVARLRWLALGEKSMHGTILRSLWAAPPGLVLMLLVGAPMVAAQAPGASPPRRQQAPAPQQNQRAEQDGLARQVKEFVGPAGSTRRRPSLSAHWSWSVGYRGSDAGREWRRHGPARRLRPAAGRLGPGGGTPEGGTGHPHAGGWEGALADGRRPAGPGVR